MVDCSPVVRSDFYRLHFITFSSNMSELFDQRILIDFCPEFCWNLKILLDSLQDFQQEKTGKP